MENSTTPIKIKWIKPVFTEDSIEDETNNDGGGPHSDGLSRDYDPQTEAE